NLLKQVAKRLSRCARKSDTVARLGGDEFTLIVSNLKNVADVEKVAQKIIRTLSAPFIIDGHEVHTSTSLGVTLYPFNDSDDVYAIVKQADTAMYQAKKLGKNNYKFYTAQLWQTELRRIKVENAVKFALERNELSLLFQPRFSLSDNAIVGAEALLRWNHPTLGAVSPVEFIPIIEGQGLIQTVGAWVLQQACEQLHNWLELLPGFRMSINVSARQLENEDFITVFRQTIDKAQINPANLEIEITEGVLIERSQQTVETLRCFKDMGVRISLDDFGAGYSSLNYLKRFSIDILKIDKSFVMDVNENNDSGAIVEAIIGLAKSMRLHVTAEGIETEQQLLFLQQRDCDEGQGYLFAKPIPATSLKEMLANQLQKAG
ncbi:putative bifunctional diguanylate cyclase/phosphodiesterase, partial [Kaarinaea lacus]